MDKPAAAVLDTNALLDVHLFADPRAAKLQEALAQGWLRWQVTSEMLAELAAVLARPLGSHWDDQRERLLAAGSLADRSDLWPTPCRVDPTLRCADPSDQKFIDLALHVGVRWLVSRDRSLLALRRQAAARGLTIVTPQDWPGY